MSRKFGSDWKRHTSIVGGRSQAVDDIRVELAGKDGGTRQDEDNP